MGSLGINVCVRQTLDLGFCAFLSTALRLVCYFVSNNVVRVEYAVWGHGNAVSNFFGAFYSCFFWVVNELYRQSRNWFSKLRIDVFDNTRNRVYALLFSTILFSSHLKFHSMISGLWLYIYISRDTYPSQPGQGHTTDELGQLVFRGVATRPCVLTLWNVRIMETTNADFYSAWWCQRLPRITTCPCVSFYCE